MNNEEFYLSYLKSFIESKGLTLYELSKLCGFDKSLLTHIFKCKRRISIDIAFKFENVLGLDAEKLLLLQLKEVIRVYKLTNCQRNVLSESK